MKREKLFNNIKYQLSFLAFQINLDNCLNLTDKNIYCENFFANILNVIFKCNLTNNNILSSTADTIDLIDEDQKICFQVTSNRSSKKIQETLKDFEDKKYFDKFDKLYFVVIGSKKYTTAFKETPYFKKEENILTMTELLRRIHSIINIEELEQIDNIVKKELNLTQPNDYVLLNEVQTIAEIITFISGKEEFNPNESMEPDPDKKINSRFKQYADSIIREFLEYTKLYKNLCDEACATLSQADISKVSTYLMRESVKELNKVKNPIQAISNMVENFKVEFAKKNLNIDEGALYYFLYKQVITCNVFPNEVTEC